MDLQFYGANCIGINYKGSRIVIDDNLKELGAKSIVKPEDVVLFTNNQHESLNARLVFDRPGEYEVSEVSIIGIRARSNMEEKGSFSSTMFKLIAGEQSILVTGHIYPELSEAQLEVIGLIDVLFIPVGGSGYTVDSVGAMSLVRAIEPKLVIPTHYSDKDLKYPVPQQSLTDALKEITMEPKETVSKLRLKGSELSEVTQLIILEKS